MSKFLDNISLIYSLINTILIFLMFIVIPFWGYWRDPIIFGFASSITGIVLGITTLIKKSNKKWKPILLIILSTLLFFFTYLLIINYHFLENSIA